MESTSDLPTVSNEFLLLAIAEADKEALRGYRKSGGNAPEARALETGFTLLADTAINDSDGIATTDTTITVDTTTGADSAGAAVVWDNNISDPFFYTGKTSTTFTGVTNIGFAHEDNDAVQFVYALPSNFGQFRRTEAYGDGVQLNGVPLRYMDGPPDPGYFSLLDDGTTKYLWLYRGATGDASVQFDKDSNTIDSTDDLISLPDDWQFFYAWRSIELSLFGRGDYAIIPVAKAKADLLKRDLLMDRNVGRMLRVRQYSSPHSHAARDYQLELANE